MQARLVLLLSTVAAGLLHTTRAAPIGLEAVRDGSNLSSSLPNIIVPHLPRPHDKRFLNDAKKALKGTAKVVKKVVVGKGKGKEEERKEKPKAAISISSKKINMGEVGQITTLVLPDGGNDRRSLKAFERSVIGGEENDKKERDVSARKTASQKGLSVGDHASLARSIEDEQTSADAADDKIERRFIRKLVGHAFRLAKKVLGWGKQAPAIAPPPSPSSPSRPRPARQNKIAWPGRKISVQRVGLLLDQAVAHAHPGVHAD